jgi:hypothetical protein
VSDADTATDIATDTATDIATDIFTDTTTDILDFKLSLCSVLTVLTFGFKPLKMDLTEGSETSTNINQTLGKHPKVNTVNY